MSLHQAIVDGNMERLLRCLNSGVDIDSKLVVYADEWTPLHTAASNDRYDCAEMLIMRGASVDARTKPHSETALSIAATHGYVKFMSLLLAHKADINSCHSDLWTPLMMAVFFSSHPNAVQLLLDRRANVLHRNKALRTSLDLARVTTLITRSDQRTAIIQMLEQAEQTSKKQATTSKTSNEPAVAVL